MTEFDDAVSTSSESASILSDDELPAEHQQLQAGSSSTSSTASEDIAQGILQSPVQPVVRKFPTTLFGSKRRSFNRSWYQKYSWLEYSTKKDAAFCYACRHFAVGSSITGACVHKIRLQ